MPPKRRGPTQHHSSAKTAKCELRRWLVDQLGGMSMVSILDCFCATGGMWTDAYDKTPRYLGLDLKRFDDERRTITGDSRRFLRHRDVELSRWNLFDLDAFGTPLEHLALVANRLRVPAGQRVGFVLTDGSKLVATRNGLPRGLLAYVGAPTMAGKGSGAHAQRELLSRIFQAAVERALKTAGLKMIDSRFAQQEQRNNAPSMRYVALLAESVTTGVPPST